MQGFNKYYPPDYDPAKNPTLNSYHNKHALGDRARKISQGILIVRFELPFNIWCGGCNAHIGAGVRYNAEKMKVGNYFSTPIFGFRCKCHLCDHWFELRTDPKNAQYIVHDGAKKKDEDWDPEENGGYAIQDTENPSTAADAFSQLEKTTTQLSAAQQREQRLFELYTLSSTTTSDPYTLSTKLRSSFRAEKKVRQGKEAKDEDLKRRLGLGDRVKLMIEDQAKEGSEGMEAWGRGRDELEKSRVALGRSRRKDDEAGAGAERLKKVVVGNTRRRFDPFHRPSSASRPLESSSVDRYEFKPAGTSRSKPRASLKLPPPKRSISTAPSSSLEVPSRAVKTLPFPLVPTKPFLEGGKASGLGLVGEYESD